MRSALRELVLFIAVIAAFTTLYYRQAATPWHLRLTEDLARSASVTLNAFGLATVVEEQPQQGARLPSYAVHDGRVAVDVAIDCNGSWAFAIFVAAVVAVRSPWRAKLWGLALGVPALWAINVLRVVSLYGVATYAPSAFEAVHLYVWQFLIIGAALLLFVAWSQYFVPPADA